MNRVNRGITLVEVLVAISITSTVAGMTGVCIHGLYRAQQATQAAVDSRSSVSRLAHRIRVDCRRATAASEDASGRTLTLVFENGEQIEYAFVGDRVIRRLSIDGDVAHRDAFITGNQLDVEWQVDTKEKIMVVRTVLSHSARSGGDTAFQQELLAMVGRRNIQRQASGGAR